MARERDEPAGGSAEQPPARKQKVSNDWPRGSVLEVRMVNFMTYTDVTVVPGPRLNLILGPNGTGKSSLVCALCVGLGGAAKLLGRSTDVGEYVKRGEKFAVVEIQLASGSAAARPLCVQRKIWHSASGPARSDWRLNGASSSAGEVSKAVAALNIQLDNLCQFLPQDRVVEFARLTPTQLLVETEKALGERELHEQHQQLIAAKADCADLEKAVAAEAERLERLQADKAGLERDVARFKQREELLAKAKRMRKKAPWLRYAAAAERYSKSRDMQKQAEASVAEKEKALAEFSAPYKEKEKQLAQLAPALEALKKALKSTDAAASAAVDRLDDAKAAVQGEEEALAREQKAAAKKAQSVASAREQLDEAKAALAAFPAAPPPRPGAPDEAELKRLVSRLSDDYHAADARLSDLEASRRLPEQRRNAIREQLRVLDSVAGQRVQALRPRFPNIESRIALIERLRAEGRFEKEVYYPLLSHVSVRLQATASYLEGQCEAWIWGAVVVQTVRDLKTVSDAMRADGLGMVPVVNRDGTVPEPHTAVPPELAAKGVTGTLDDGCEAPSAVRNVLCDTGGINTAFVGTSVSDSHSNELTQRLNVLWTPSNQYFTTQSRFGDRLRTTRMKQVRPPRLFSSSVAVNAEKRTETLAEIAKEEAELQRIDRDVAALRSEVEALKARRDAAREQRLQADAEKNAHTAKRGKLERTVVSREAVLRSELAAEDSASKLARLAKARDKALAQHAGLAVAAAAAVCDKFARFEAYAPKTLQVAELKEQARVLKAQLEERSGALLAAKNTLAGVKEVAKRDKEAGKAAHEAAQRESPEGADAFEDLPTTMEELEELIAETEGEADSIMCPNPAVMAQYNRIHDELRSLEKTHGESTGSLAARQARIDSTKAAWLPRLRQLFERINSAFSASFAAMGCAGEVRLVEHEDSFTEYAVELLVKFRSGEPLQRLNPNRQSGGERSVSTMLYLIGLQDLTKCPFRVVDEINQGMDEVNERKIFKQMVLSACAPGTPQCFLLTPKLLPQLEYTPEVTVLCIFNGPWIRPVARGFQRELFLGAATPKPEEEEVEMLEEEEDDD